MKRRSTAIFTFAISSMICSMTMGQSMPVAEPPASSQVAPDTSGTTSTVATPAVTPATAPATTGATTANATTHATATAAPSAQEVEHGNIGAEPTPAGRFAFSTQAGAHRLFVRAGVDVIAQYALRITDTPAGPDWFHRFDLGRAHAALAVSWGPARARLVLEAVRSASEGALLGVAGDSLLFRVREGFAAWRPFSWLEAQAGVVPTLTIPTLEVAWASRAIAPASLESTGLASPADLGVTVRAALPRSLGTLAIGAFNGEGYALRELNRGKNLEFAMDLRPFATLGLPELALVASFVLGSSGTGRARSDRLTVGAQFDRPRYGGGAMTTVAWGVADSSERTSVLAEAFARVEPVQRWLLSARVTYWNRNLALADDSLWTVLFGTGVRLADPLSAWVAVSRSIAGPSTLSALPGSAAWEIRAVTRAVF